MNAIAIATILCALGVAARQTPDLFSSDAAVRRAAAKAIVHEMRSDKVDWRSLLKALGDDDTETRMWVARAIGRHAPKNDEVFDSLMRAIRTERHWLARNAALNVLASFGESRWREIVALYKSMPEESLPVSALAHLPKGSDAWNREVLGWVAKKGDDYTLGELSTGFRIPVDYLLVNEDRAIRSCAAGVLIRRRPKDRRVAGVLMGILDDPQASREVRNHAGSYYAYARIPGVAHLESLVRALDKVDDPVIRSLLCYSIRDSKSDIPSVRPTLEKLALNGNDGRDQEAALAVLADRYGTAAIPTLHAALDDANVGVREQATSILGEFGLAALGSVPKIRDHVRRSRITEETGQLAIFRILTDNR